MFPHRNLLGLILFLALDRFNNVWLSGSLASFFIDFIPGKKKILVNLFIDAIFGIIYLYHGQDTHYSYSQTELFNYDKDHAIDSIDDLTAIKHNKMEPGLSQFLLSSHMVNMHICIYGEQSPLVRVPYHRNINRQPKRDCISLMILSKITTRLFVQSDRDCRQFCEDTADCRFYYWLNF